MKHNIPPRAEEDIIKYAKINGVKTVILFGSRARGTNGERSDIDLAVKGGDSHKFHSDLEELAHTLLMFDVVDLDKRVSDELLREIDRDGVVIYEEI